MLSRLPILCRTRTARAPTLSIPSHLLIPMQACEFSLTRSRLRFFLPVCSPLPLLLLPSVAEAGMQVCAKRPGKSKQDREARMVFRYRLLLHTTPYGVLCRQQAKLVDKYYQTREKSAKLFRTETLAKKRAISLSPTSLQVARWNETLGCTDTSRFVCLVASFPDL